MSHSDRMNALKYGGIVSSVYWRVVCFFIVLLFSGYRSAIAQEWHPGNPIRMKLGSGDSTLTIHPYALVRLVMIATDRQIYVSDPGTKTGIYLEQKFGSGFSLFGAFELSMRFSNTGQYLSLSPDNSTAGGGFSNTIIKPPQNVFALRMGYLGLDFKKWGSVIIGKQESAFKLAGGQADISETNSGFANYIFSPEGSDGGFSGTGRPDNCLTYKNMIAGRLHLAASFVMDLDENDSIRQAVDAASISAICNVAGGFNLSVAYNHVFLANSFYRNRVIYGLNGDPAYFLVGAQYRSGNFMLAANYVMQHDGDLTNIKNTNSGLEVVTKSVVYSGSGFELAGQYDYKRWRFLGGVNIKKPEQDTDHLMDPDFHRHLIFYGVQYRHSMPLTIFFEGRIEDSKDANGIRLPDANMVGLRINL